MRSGRKTSDEERVAEVAAEYKSLGFRNNHWAFVLLLAIKSGASIDELDGLMVRLLEGLDGSDSFLKSRGAKSSFLAPVLPFIRRLNSFRSKQFKFTETYDSCPSGTARLKGWELVAEEFGLLAFASKRLKLRKLANHASRSVGTVFAEKLLKSSGKDLQTITKGLLNLEAGRPFRAKAGEPGKDEFREVLLAFHLLREGGAARPSQRDVIDHLAAKGISIGRRSVSKAFDHWGLGEHAADARRSDPAKGRRHRRKV